MEPKKTQEWMGRYRIWYNRLMKYIKGWEGLYSITKSGHIYSHRLNGFLRPAPNPAGYLHATLKDNGRKNTYDLHRLVAEMFIPNPLSKKEVNHLNGNKADNRTSNLEWATPRENGSHASRTGLVPRGERNHNAKLTTDKVRKIRSSIGKSQSQLAREFGVSQGTIWEILHRQIWKQI